VRKEYDNMSTISTSAFRRRLIVALAAVLSLTLVACGGGGGSAAGGKPEIVVWNGYTDEQGKNFTALIDEYNQQHPDVQVTQLVSDTDHVLQKILTSVRGNTPPDIAYMYGSWSTNIAKMSKVVDLTEEVKQSGWDWNDFYPALRDSATVGGKVIGVPALVDNLAIVYNKKLFDEAHVAPPSPEWTWDDFRSAAAKLTDSGKGQYGFTMPADTSETVAWHYLPMLWEAGGDVLTPDMTEAAFNSEAGVRSLTTLQQMTVTDKSVYLDTTNTTAVKLMNSGKIGMITTGPWDLATFTDIDYGVQIMPTYAGSDAGHQTVSGPDNWVVFDNGDKRKRASVDFLKWITAPEQVRRSSLATGDLPIRKSVGDDPTFVHQLDEKVSGTGVFVENLNNVKKSKPAVAQYPEVATALGQAIVSVMLGRAEPGPALNDAASVANAALAQK
jgi:multiple sugar transport system substrate-binding protein